MEKELKDKIMAAFEEGMDPIQAVITFEVVPEEIRKLYEEYHEAKGGMVIWGDTAQKLSELLGCEIKSARDLIVALQVLAHLTKGLRGDESDNGEQAS
jgi:hypothetical protein